MALRKIKPLYRIPLILAEIEDKEYSEIAKILRINANTVRTRIKRARAILFKNFMKQERQENIAKTLGRILNSAS